MFHMNAVSGRMIAAVTAIALSFVLISGTVSTPAQAQSPRVAYVGVVA